MSERDSTADEYLSEIRAQVPLYEELQAAVIQAIPIRPATILELGIGTGETTRRLLEAFPEAKITGLDSDGDMIFRARELIEDVQLARMEDPLPDGPWDLIVSVLSVHELNEEQKQTLFRRIKEQARALVLGDLVRPAGGAESPSERTGRGFDETAAHLAEWSEGEIAWQSGNVAVIRAVY